MYPLLQYMLPQHLLSRFVGKFAASENQWLKQTFINQFSKHYAVNMDEAANSDLNSYPSFNAFFTRHLQAEARPIDQAADSIISPVDGFIGDFGKIEQGKLIQAKKHDYSLLELLAGDHQLTDQFRDGDFVTYYLSPKDYHRIHMPIAGKLTQMIYVPGKLFSVAPNVIEAIPNVFARNERLICMFDTDLGPMAVIFVGAVIVASIATVWQGIIAPNREKAIRRWQYPNARTKEQKFDKGDEIGHFQLGSTVIVLTTANKILLDQQLKLGQAIKLGQSVAVKY